jgi:tetratricopeptide (TPR) repeat protein
MPPFLALAPALALLAACATGTPVPDQAASPAPAAPLEQEAPEPAERPIPDDSLYPLLLAEFALRNRDYEVALEQYLEQAELLRDPGVSAHTTHLAQFMQREREALASVQLWVELEPDNLEANNTLATLLVRQGKPHEALPHLTLVLRGGGDPRFPMLLNGFDELAPEQQAALVQGLNELSQEYPDNTQLILTRALVQAQFEQFDEALAGLAEVFKLEPYQQQALLLEARILINREDPKPFARIERALEEDPGDKRLRLQYARLLAAEDLPAARKQFEILSSQSPRDGDLLLSLALINREIGDTSEAKAYLRQMIALGQRTGEANYYLGRIAEEQGDTDAALYHYRQVEEGRELLGAAQRSGQILIDQDRLEESHALFNQRRAGHPPRSEQLYGVEADLLTKNGHPGEAMTVLNQALADFPDSATLRYSRSMLGEQRNDLALMESDLRYIIEREPDNATALNALGYTLANRTDRYDEAYQLISRALELQPEEPAILDSMGWVLYRKGEYQKALTYLTRAYAAFPDPEVAAHLGEVLWVIGEEERATQVWQGALMRSPDHEVLLNTLKRFGVSLTATPDKAMQPR